MFKGVSIYEVAKQLRRELKAAIIKASETGYVYNVAATNQIRGA